MAFERFQEEWSDMDPKFRWILIAIVVVGVVVIGVRAMQPDKTPAVDASKSAPMVGADGVVIDAFKARLLPDTPRNQGIEVLTLKVQQLTERMDLADRAQGNARVGDGAGVQALPPAGLAASAAAAASSAKGSGVDSAITFGSTLPPSFDPPGAGNASRVGTMPNGQSPAGIGAGVPRDGATIPAAELPAARMKVWPADVLSSVQLGDGIGIGVGGPVIPVNSALESVMLSGVNARPSGSIGGAVGSVNSANKVGAPFVTRIKGEAIMPNGWKLDDLGDCFLGGSGIAILSTERAYVIADNLSCISASGEVYEAAIKAYGLDVDGTLGIAGKVVSKQGSLLLQAALTGLASGLGGALSPSTLPSYNSNAQSGSSTGVQYPNPAAVAQTAVGQGISHAAGLLSKFYLDYAKEVFPVVEITSGTRVTWVLTESVELKRRSTKVALK